MRSSESMRPVARSSVALTAKASRKVFALSLASDSIFTLSMNSNMTPKTRVVDSKMLIASSGTFVLKFIGHRR